MSQPAFPLNPIDGQEFIDEYRIKWLYDFEENQWVWIGPIVDLPVARSGNNCVVED